MITKDITFIVGLVVAALFSTISSMLDVDATEVKIGSKRISLPSKTGAIKAVVCGFAVAIFYYYADKLSAPLALVMMAAMLALMVYLILWWKDEASNVKELIVFVLLDSLLSLVAKSLAMRSYDIFSARWLIGIFTALPTMMLLVSLGIFIADMIWFRERLKGGGLNETRNAGN